MPLSSDYAGLVFIASEHDSQEPAERCPFPFPLQLPDIVLVRGGRPGFCPDEEFLSFFSASGTLGDLHAAGVSRASL